LAEVRGIKKRKANDMFSSDHDDGSGRLPRHQSVETAPEAMSRENGQHSYDGRHTYDSALRTVQSIRNELIRVSNEAVALCQVLGRDHLPQMQLDAIAQLDEIESDILRKVDAANRHRFV
jgi:hypothetical protein